MSALCLSHSHSAADMEGLAPASVASSSSACTAAPPTAAASSCNSSSSSTITTTSSSSSSNSSSTLSTGRGEFLEGGGVVNGVVVFSVSLPLQTQETLKHPQPK